MSCFYVLEYWQETSATRCEGGLLHLAQAQNVHAAVELAAVCRMQHVVGNSGQKTAGCWFESGWWTCEDDTTRNG